LGAGSGDDFFLQTETLGDVEAGGGAGNTEAQFVGGSQSLLIKADSCVEDTGMIRGIDLKRGEMSGDAAPGVDSEEVRGDSYGQGCALFGVGRGT
jgi:hypothetical protein